MQSMTAPSQSFQAPPTGNHSRARPPGGGGTTPPAPPTGGGGTTTVNPDGTYTFNDPRVTDPNGNGIRARQTPHGTIVGHGNKPPPITTGGNYYWNSEDPRPEQPNVEGGTNTYGVDTLFSRVGMRRINGPGGNSIIRPPSSNPLPVAQPTPPEDTEEPTTPPNPTPTGGGNPTPPRPTPTGGGSPVTPPNPVTTPPVTNTGNPMLDAGNGNDPRGDGSTVDADGNVVPDANAGTSTESFRQYLTEQIQSPLVDVREVLDPSTTSAAIARNQIDNAYQGVWDYVRGLEGQVPANLYRQLLNRASNQQAAWRTQWENIYGRDWDSKDPEDSLIRDNTPPPPTQGPGPVAPTDFNGSNEIWAQATTELSKDLYDLGDMFSTSNPPGQVARQVVEAQQGVLQWINEYNWPPEIQDQLIERAYDQLSQWRTQFSDQYGSPLASFLGAPTLSGGR